MLETTPIDALESLHLVTADGKVLQLNPSTYLPEPEPRFHLYQEFSPITPRVVSAFEPARFGQQITSARNRVFVPTIVFGELKIGRLAHDPDATDTDNLPYLNIEHLRDCLRELKSKPEKPTKTVIRYLQQDVLFRTIRGGFYVAQNGESFRYFAFPDLNALESQYYPWWRSALSTFGA